MFEFEGMLYSYENFDHAEYARNWCIDWDWFHEMEAEWEEENKPDPTIADLLGIWED